MAGYGPIELNSLLTTLVVLTVELVAGYALTAVRRVSVARGAAWALTVVSFVALERWTAVAPAGFRMLAIVGAVLLGMKTLVCIESQAAGGPRLAWPRFLAFSTLWFGMRPAVFAYGTQTERSGGGELIARGWRRLTAGMALIALAGVLAHSSLSDRPVFRLAPHPDSFWLSPKEIAATIPLLLGLSLTLHFGIFNLLAGAWRKAGVDCRALFRAPFAARSLADFWARRWNLGFTEMTSLAVFRPLRKHLGKRGAAFLSFLFSGLLHELAISVPVKAGFGLPMLYFALHACATAIERRVERAGQSLSARPWLGWTWTMAWILLPLPLLFHPPFLRGCFWPLIGAS